MSDTAGFMLLDSKGNQYPDDEGIAGIINPSSDNYRLKINPKSSKSLIIIAQFLEDGRVLWKEYNFSGTAPMQKSLLFNSLNPQEDALR